MFLLAQNHAAALYWYRGEYWIVPSDPAATMTRVQPPTERGHAAQFDADALRYRRHYVLETVIAQFANLCGAPSFRPPCPLFLAHA